ncbi:Putative LOC100197594, partial [Caligus rogercresseyi]
MNKPLIRGRKIIQQLSQDSRHQFSGQMINFTVQATHNMKMTGFCRGRMRTSPWSGGQPSNRNPPSVMVWAGVTSDGKRAPLIFVEEGVKVDQAVYFYLLSEEVVPWVQR